ncbi:Protein of uncharacterised function (DUF3710) [Arthrobacter agilis]|uniref:DUF3710 domain-containing protein n=1 Tax=Arthrobacter agilis TaxID=37921 RepID=UPI000B3542DD|nr:DUF3710 domain-containing protein [Arthrobacter agilis]OUM45000.1 hypothetical protein B8W74_01775 [Arthrobacter agilis]VDR31863.1 Protein of uncharacterised function (DUF3710) [Arthrobacter agilis]
MAFGRLRKKKQDDADGAPEQEAELATPAGETVPATADGGSAPVDSDSAPAAVDGDPAPAPADGDSAPAADAVPADSPPVPAGHVSSKDYDRTALGPFDESEQDTGSGYIDLGALRINAAEGLQLRLEVEERSKRVIAVTLDLAGSTLQLQAFAAPKTEGLWDEIREQIGVSVGSQGGTVEERPGRLGTELLAKLPAQTPDGQPGFRVARFVGINGPRWFLRGVFGGPAAFQPAAAASVEALFRSVVVVRGDHPLPPRELLQLKLPKDAGGPAPAAPTAEPARPDLNPLERGPEITETR